MFSKKVFPYIIFFVSPLVFVIIGVFIGYFGVEFSTEVLHIFGQISIWLLTLMLLSKYFVKIPLLSIISKYKKEIGISSFLFALLHILLYAFSTSNLISEILQRRYILLGFLLFTLMFFMFVTSFFYKKIFFKISPLILPFSLFGAIHYLFSTKVISLYAVIVFAILFTLVCIKIYKNS